MVVLCEPHSSIVPNRVFPFKCQGYQRNRFRASATINLLVMEFTAKKLDRSPNQSLALEDMQDSATVS
jgi:hypothetical protein